MQIIYTPSPSIGIHNYTGREKTWQEKKTFLLEKDQSYFYNGNIYMFDIQYLGGRTIKIDICPQYVVCILLSFKNSYSLIWGIRTIKDSWNQA